MKHVTFPSYTATPFPSSWIVITKSPINLACLDYPSASSSIKRDACKNISKAGW